MKKSILVIVCCILTALLFTLPAFAISDTDYVLELASDDGTGYPVIAISGDGYRNNDKATTVIVPKNIISLGEGLFSGCSKLDQIKLHSELQVIEKNVFANTAFYNTKSNWDNGVLYIGDALIEADFRKIGTSYRIKEGCRIIAAAAFDGCDLKNVSIPDTVQHVGKNAFANTKVKSEDNYENGLLIVDNVLLDCVKQYEGKIIIPDGVRTIADGAFECCINITEIETPESVTYIGQDAFNGCASLQKITLGKNVKTIGLKPFRLCQSLQTISVSEENEHFVTVDGILYNKQITELIRCPQKKNGNIDIPCSVYKIDACSFEDCKELQTVSLPNGAAFIGKNAFANCDNLQQISIPSSMEYISGYAFDNCSNLTQIFIPDNVYFLGDAVFRNCKALSTASIGNKVTQLGANLFLSCENLKEVKLGDGIQEIAATAFAGTNYLSDNSKYTNGMLINNKYLLAVHEDVTECTIPANVTIIANGAFASVDNLQSLHISETLEKFNYKAFCDILILEVPIYYEGGIYDFYEKTNFDSTINIFTADFYTSLWCVVGFSLASLFLIIISPFIWDKKYKKLEMEDIEDDEE